MFLHLHFTISNHSQDLETALSECEEKAKALQTTLEEKEEELEAVVGDKQVKYPRKIKYFSQNFKCNVQQILIEISRGMLSHFEHQIKYFHQITKSIQC